MLSLKQIYVLLGLEGNTPSRFPPCMLWMAKNMRDKAHLKHDARLQMAFFLKHVGVPWDVTDRFMREEFSRHGISSTDFDKKYK